MEAAVVVTYAAPPGMLAACLDAISGAGGIGYVVVVDTGGRARADGYVAELAAAGTIELVETENHGLRRGGQRRLRPRAGGRRRPWWRC